jgi:hypothetical protein
VITPRSEETKKVSRVAEKLDGVILHTRMSCDDLSQAEHLFTRIHELIRGLHELIADFCAQVELPYRTPREAEDLLRQRPDPDGPCLQEEVPSSSSDVTRTRVKRDLW